MRRKSVAQKQAQGTYRPDRDRNTLAFEGSNEVASKPPTYIKQNKLALQEWRRVAPPLEAEGVLRTADISLLSSYCVLYSRWRAASADVDEKGQTIIVTSTTRTGKTEKPVSNPSVRNEVIYQAAMMKAAVKFGLNPLDRPRVQVNPDADELDPLQQFVQDGLDDDAERAARAASKSVAKASDELDEFDQFLADGEDE